MASNRASCTRQMTLHVAVNRFNWASVTSAQRDAALIRDHDHGHAGTIHTGNRIDCSRQPFKLRPVADISALGQLTVQNAIAIQKYAAHYNYQG